PEEVRHARARLLGAHREHHLVLKPVHALEDDPLVGSRLEVRVERLRGPHDSNHWFLVASTEICHLPSREGQIGEKRMKRSHARLMLVIVATVCSCKQSNGTPAPSKERPP